MRVLLLSILLIACTCAKKDNVNVSNETLLENLNVTRILEIYKQFKGMAKKIITTIEPTVEKRKKLIKTFENVTAMLSKKSSNLTLDQIKANMTGLFLFQGDITLTKSQADDIQKDIEAQYKNLKKGKSGRTKRFAYKGSKYPENRWDEGVYYYFHNSTTKPQQEAFRRAVKAWSNNTCVDFFEDDKAEDRVVVARSYFCSSFVGKIGGEQAIYQAPYCDHFRGAAHALGHVLGLLHPMSREDRDEHITVKGENILPPILFQFLKQTNQTNNDYGLGYDLGSIMHSSLQSGAVNNTTITLEPVDKNFTKTAPSETISFNDLRAVNIHYQCEERCKNVTAPKCENGGYQHPRDCGKCLCPSGFAGTLCNERPRGCGNERNATEEWQPLIDELKNNKPDPLDGYSRCNYWIRSPEETKIEIEIISFDNKSKTKAVFCNEAGVEIKTNKDPALTGYRFCSKEDARTLKSSSNLVPVITYNRLADKSTVALKYRYVKA
ncbi:hypothetical protein RB195_021612 [Necator americanus]|uniref:Zinc metalloproteinase n=1 Tax=Necator americanus TaxID=51031 RepID=A0ABR1EBX6_NECAM